MDRYDSTLCEIQAWIGIGSNLHDPVLQVERAVAGLADLVSSRLLRASSLYRSAPMGPAGQPDYINAVAEIATTLPPHRLLDELFAVEAAAGRRRDGERWGPRILDLDILLYGDAVIADERLCVPHPGLPLRPFVLYPLCELEPTLFVPGAGTVEELIGRSPAGGLTRVEQR